MCKDPFGVGCINVSTIGDHIIPKAAGGTDSLEHNLQGVCTDCHNRKTVLEQSVTFVPGCTCEIVTRITVSGRVVTTACEAHAAHGAVPVSAWTRLVA